MAMIKMEKFNLLVRKCVCVTCPLKLWWKNYFYTCFVVASNCSLTKTSLLNSSSSKFIHHLLLWVMQAMSSWLFFHISTVVIKLNDFSCFFLSVSCSWEVKMRTLMQIKWEVKRKNYYDCFENELLKFQQKKLALRIT